MNKNLGTKTAVIIATLLIFTYGIFFGNEPKKSWDAIKSEGLLGGVKQNIHLGLDLKGGTHLILQVMTDEAVGAEVDRTAERLKDQLKEKKIAFTQIARSPKRYDQLTITGLSDNSVSDVRAMTDISYTDYDLATGSDGNYTLTMKQQSVATLKSATVTRSIETIRSRVDTMGVSEPTIQEHGLGEDQILVQLPGVDDPIRVRQIMSETGMLEFRLVLDGPFNTVEEANASPSLATGVVLPEEGKSGQTAYFVITRSAVISGEDIRSATPETSDFKGTVVHFTLKTDAGKRFEAFTEANVSKRLAVVLSGHVKSAPVINSKIGDSGIIEGLTAQEAKDLSKILESGALPASIKYMEDRTVGATLGADSIKQGVTAGVVGLLLVIGFMLFYYKGAGINANLALILNVVILLGFLGFFGNVLTLPGIAGVILTVGMGVDSNVLIFERIREEMRLGKSPSASVDQGFGRAWLTIIDTHITTIVSGLILFMFGTGPVRGFAVTLSFGLAANLFTAVFVSRVIFEYILSKKERGEALSI